MPSFFVTPLRIIAYIVNYRAGYFYLKEKKKFGGREGVVSKVYAREKIHFIGIGGVGMSGIAQLLLELAITFPVQTCKFRK